MNFYVIKLNYYRDPNIIMEEPPCNKTLLQEQNNYLETFMFTD